MLVLDSTNVELELDGMFDGISPFPSKNRRKGSISFSFQGENLKLNKIPATIYNYKRMNQKSYKKPRKL
jgi:hypothetical protein